MRREESLPNFLTRDLLIRFGIFIPIGKEFIPGGRIASAQEQKMPDGGSIISVFRKFERASERCEDFDRCDGIGSLSY